jgi:transcriptional regulator with XRE-family HTH domain
MGFMEIKHTGPWSRLRLYSPLFRLEFRLYSQAPKAFRRTVLLTVIRVLKPLYGLKAGEIVHSETGPRILTFWPERPPSLRRTSHPGHSAGALGFLIRLNRLRIGLTQAQLAQQIGIAPARLSDLETGKALPRLSTQRKLEAALSCQFRVDRISCRKNGTATKRQVGRREWNQRPGQTPAERQDGDWRGEVDPQWRNKLRLPPL